MWAPLFPYINIIDKQYINMQLFNNGIREGGLTYSYKALAIISKRSSLSNAIILTLCDIHGSTLLHISTYTMSENHTKFTGYSLVLNHNLCYILRSGSLQYIHANTGCWELRQGKLFWRMITQFQLDSICALRQRGSWEGTVENPPPFSFYLFLATVNLKGETT